jgi:Na+(H+)/acetate symporter ActP
LFLSYEDLGVKGIVLLASIWGGLAGATYYGLAPWPVLVVGTLLLDIFLVLKYFGGNIWIR